MSRGQEVKEYNKKYLRNASYQHILKPSWENKTAAQAAGQTLPDAIPPIGKIHPLAKSP